MTDSEYGIDKDYLIEAIMPDSAKMRVLCIEFSESPIPR